MSDCNPACVKIILNGGFMASAAELLANLERQGNPSVRAAALRLAEIARAYVTVAEHAIKYGALKRVGADLDWHGCEQGKAIMVWVRASGYVSDSAAAQMNEWADDLLAQMQALMSGVEP